jgi:murein DD-endopeptidase MepM/ murein hydrolase activator NlpD
MGDLNADQLENTEAVFVPTFPPVTNIDALAAYQTVKEKPGVGSLQNIIFQGISNEFTLTPKAKETLFSTIEGISSEDESPEEQKNINDPDKDILTASNLIDYYGKIAKMDFFKNSLSTLFPVTLTLSIYGISSLIPGNCVRVDYMPERYRDRVYFQIMKITHSISNTWTTTFDLQYRIRPAAIAGQVEPKPTYLKTKSIYVNKGYFKTLKHWDKYKNMFGKITPLRSRFRNIDQIFRATLYPQNRPDKDKEHKDFYLIEDTLPKIEVEKLFNLLGLGNPFKEGRGFPAPGMPSGLFGGEKLSHLKKGGEFEGIKMWLHWMEIYWGWYNLHWMPKSFPVTPYKSSNYKHAQGDFDQESWKLYGKNKVTSTIALLKPNISLEESDNKFKYMQNNEVYILVGGNNGSKKYWTVGFPYRPDEWSITTSKAPPLIGQASPSLYAAFCSDPDFGAEPFFNKLLQEYRKFGDSGVITSFDQRTDKEDLFGWVGASQARRWVGAKIFNEKVKQYKQIADVADEPEIQDTEDAFPFINPSVSITSLGDGFPKRHDYYDENGILIRGARHLGVDLRMNIGTPLKAVKAGTIEKAGQEYNAPGIVNGAGLAVLLRIDRDLVGTDGIRYVWYFHLSSLSSPRAGDIVEQGDTIGYSGGCYWIGSDGVPSRLNSGCKMCESNGVLEYDSEGDWADYACTQFDGSKAHGNITSGNSTGPHLHYEMKTLRVAGNVDPAPHLTYPQMPA